MRSRSLRAHEMGPGGASLTPSAHPSRRTVFRKLQMLDAISSCSNRRLYYTLRISARLDAHGLWAHGGSGFRCKAPCAPPWPCCWSRAPLTRSLCISPAARLARRQANRLHRRRDRSSPPRLDAWVVLLPLYSASAPPPRPSPPVAWSWAGNPLPRNTFCGVLDRPDCLHFYPT